MTSTPSQPQPKVILGGTGTGKTRMAENTALPAINQGDEMWLLDPQDGASSPALKQHAARYAGKADMDDMLAAAEAVVAQRTKENSQQPGLLLVIEECHQVFRSETADRWAAVTRNAGKVNLALLCTLQHSGPETFGNSEALRSSFNSTAV